MKPRVGGASKLHIPRRSASEQWLFCGRFRLGVLAAEALDASGGVHELLLAGEERVAIGADFDVYVALVGGPGHELVAAGAVHADLLVMRVDCCLHGA